MWILQFIHHRDIIQLDVQILIHALQSTSNGDVVFELDRDFVVHQRLEEAEEEHGGLGVCYRIDVGGMSRVES
jgi:hypothetical protein